jgi:hypothetical protein
VVAWRGQGRFTWRPHFAVLLLECVQEVFLAGPAYRSSHAPKFRGGQWQTIYDNFACQLLDGNLSESVPSPEAVRKFYSRATLRLPAALRIHDLVAQGWPARPPRMTWRKYFENICFLSASPRPFCVTAGKCISAHLAATPFGQAPNRQDSTRWIARTSLPPTASTIYSRTC